MQHKCEYKYLMRTYNYLEMFTSKKYFLAISKLIETMIEIKYYTLLYLYYTYYYTYIILIYYTYIHLLRI